MRGDPGRTGPLIGAPGWRYALIAALYAHQGLVAGFALTAIPNHFAALGASTGEIGAHVATVGLPWILQPLWGPVVDRFGGFAMGRRRFWVLLALTASLLALARLLLVEEGGVATLPAISAVFLVQGALAALNDTATDGMIIDNVPPERLGTANAVTRTGFVTGGAAGAALFAWMLPAHGLHASALVLLGFGGGVLLLQMLVREDADDARLSLRRKHARAAAGEGFATLLRRLFASLRGGATPLLLVFCFATDFGAAIFRLPLSVELIQARGWEAEALSRFQAGMGLVTGTLGALAIGWWTDRAGPGRALAVLLGLCGIAHVLSGALLMVPEPRWAAMAGPLALGLSTVLPALLFVALAPAVMRASLGPAAATRFALFMAALNMGDVTGSAVAGDAAALMGLPSVGLAAGALFLVFALLSATGGLRRLGAT
ncbi:MFS transporter [Pararoseomonas indoligenes]|uniref:MFS transporter n=1 Tax=Roseomonas indoligenes TaxID=2820811 RepID=A0A940MQS6_9PROT|nr:MFS transporter [Pararoseomonas indoligenes]MBP0491764.1 MFS transporter [Pararoseomonas indoligenes]